MALVISNLVARVLDRILALLVFHFHFLFPALEFFL